MLQHGARPFFMLEFLSFERVLLQEQLKNCSRASAHVSLTIVELGCHWESNQVVCIYRPVNKEQNTLGCLNAQCKALSLIMLVRLKSPSLRQLDSVTRTALGTPKH